MTERSGFGELLGEVRARVDPELSSIWEQALRPRRHLGSAVEQPLLCARDLCLRGGKRLRAGLVAVGHRLGGGESLDDVIDVACAVELLQAYFLIHDDWMDGDSLRRGGPSVHAALEAEFGGRAGAGAILAGDFTLALATRVLARASAPRADRSKLWSRFAELQLDAVVGQQLDVLGDGRDPETIYRLKTSSYSVRGPLELGLILAGSARESTLDLESFADAVGVAFQLRDDLIGAFAEANVSGKPKGSDLRSGKHTPLVQSARELASEAEWAAISGVLGRLTASDGDVEAALEALRRCGARRAVEMRIEALSSTARGALRALSLSDDERALLTGLASALIDRES